MINLINQYILIILNNRTFVKLTTGIFLKNLSNLSGEITRMNEKAPAHERKISASIGYGYRGTVQPRFVILDVDRNRGPDVAGDVAGAEERLADDLPLFETVIFDHRFRRLEIVDEPLFRFLVKLALGSPWEFKNLLMDERRRVDHLVIGT